MRTQFIFLPVDALQPGRYQPRLDFEQKALEELTQSIRSQGLIEPLVVRELYSAHYEIIAGERRWRAAKLAGLTEVPCLVGHYTDEQAATLTLIENIQRQDLNLIEEANGYRRLSDEFHFHQEEMAILVGKSRSHVANLLRLLTLCDRIQDQIKAGQLTLGHARTLVGLSQAEQLFFAEEIETNQWSVRELEKKIKEFKTRSVAKISPQKDRDIERLQVILAEQVGAPVQIISNEEKGGWLQIKFFDNDSLAGLLEKMGLRYD